MTPAGMSDDAPAPPVTKQRDPDELVWTIAECVRSLQLSVHTGRMDRASEQINRLRVLVGLWPEEVNP